MPDLQSDPVEPPPAGPTSAYGSRAYGYYVLFALIVVYTFNFIDRTLVSVLNDPIRETFGLSDTMMGLLAGPAFAIIYSLLGIPFALLAERTSRTWIIAACMAVWSGFTALCGYAQNATQFALSRFGVGIGEAGSGPPSHSIISDYFPPERRSTALSIFAVGIPLGVMLAALGGAWIASQHSLNWRDSFIWLGLPGLIGAILFKLTVKDPPRGYSDPGGAAATAARARPGVLAAFGVLSRKTSFWHVSLGGGFAAFAGFGTQQFNASFWTRAHGLTLMQAALVYGGVLGIAAGVGTLGSGILADRVRKRHPNSDSWLPALGLSLACPFYAFGFNTLSFSSGTAAIWLAIIPLAIASMLRFAYMGPMFSITQKLAEPRMRSTAAALMLFVVNLIGYGLGPPVVGWFSDRGAQWQLAQLHSPVGLAECGRAEARLKAARDERKGALVVGEPELAAASTTNASYCAPARKTGIRVGLTVGSMFFLLAALHFMLLSRTMKRELWISPVA